MTELDRYLDGFGAQLREAKPPPRRRGLALGGALAVATAVAVALLLLAPRGARPGPVDAVAAARKVLDPAGVILHMRLRIDAPDGRARSFQETWSAQKPQRWRLKWWNQGLAPKYQGPGEVAYGDGEQSLYLRGRLGIVRGYEEHSPQARVPTIFSQQGGDPDSDLRTLLTSGKLTDEGELQAGGRTVRRLIRVDGVRTLVFDVDPVTFVPLGGSITIRPPGIATTSTFAVEAFERLPITAETEQLLKIAPAPGTRATVTTRRPSR